MLQDQGAAQGAAASTGPSQQAPGRPNYGKIHAAPLPVTVYPLPAFVPHNPLSALRIIYIVCSQYLWPPSSHPAVIYKGYFSFETRSVHVTNEETIRALWEKGFFGKGSLSRSEPEWLQKEKRRRGLRASVTAYEITHKRRDERREFKRERARKEQEAIEEQLRKEGKIAASETTLSEDSGSSQNEEAETLANGISTTRSNFPAEKPNHYAVENVNGTIADSNSKDVLPLRQGLGTKPSTASDDSNVRPEGGESEDMVTNQEHLQLSLDEAFFLAYGLGVLQVLHPQTQSVLDTPKLLEIFRSHSYFPPVSTDALRSDDPFLLNYVVYHHFRSLGWVVRPGIKFAVDFLLYLRGPVFAHAQFAVLVIPSYMHHYWSETPERRLEVEKKRRQKDWAWLHCVNRVQGQVMKTLVLVYVDVPPPDDVPSEDDVGIGVLLKKYKVREFVLKRWNANRNRD